MAPKSTATDSNVGNELGHTIYPKWITNKDGDRVVVTSEDEEKAAVSVEVAKEDKKSPGWNK